MQLSWPELRRQVGAVAGRLQLASIGPGDRVCAILPNTPATAMAFLACASVGAIWSICSPDTGPVAVLDRSRQIEPKLLLAADGQVWAAWRTTGAMVDRTRPIGAGGGFLSERLVYLRA